MSIGFNWTICGIPFSLDADFEEYFQIRKYYEELVIEKESEITDLYENKITGYDGIYETLLPHIISDINDVLEDSVDILFDNGVTDIDEDVLARLFSESFDMEEALEDILGIDQELCNTIAELASIRNMKRNSHGKWVGGGFGIQGAIAGVLTAGVLNAGASVLKGVGNSGLKMRDSLAISAMKRKVYNDLKDEIIDCFSCTYNDSLLTICEIVYQILVTRNNLPVAKFDDPTAIATAKNIRKRYKAGKMAEHEALEKLVRCKEKEPYHMWIDYFIYEIEPSSKEVLCEIDDFLGYGKDTRYYLSKMQLNDDYEWEENPSLKIDDSINEIDLNEFQEYLDGIKLLCEKFSELYGYTNLAENLSSTLKIRNGCDCYLAHDDSVFKRGKNGFAITSDGFYCKPILGDVQIVSWDQFKCVTTDKICYDKDNTASIMLDDIPITYYCGCNHKDELLSLILKIHQLLNK